MSDASNLWINRLRKDFRASLAVVLLLACAPLVVTTPYSFGILIVSIYFALLALGWNLLAGFTGQFSLAPAAFAMLGAYTTALLDYHLQAPLAIGIPAAIIATALLGWMLGKVVLRLKGPYLSLTTLSFAEIARVVIGNSIRVHPGRPGPERADAVREPGRIFLSLPGGVAGGPLIALYLLMKSRVGRYWLAIRDDATGAESRGIDVVRYKTLAFALSCAICGLAGSLYGTFSQLVSPELGLLMQTGLVISMVVIGGMGTLTGAHRRRPAGLSGLRVAARFRQHPDDRFAAAVILFARFLRTGLWGLASRRFWQKAGSGKP